MAGQSNPHPPASTSSLDALQNDEQRKVLNIVDSLRQCGLDGIISLPQLVVDGLLSEGHVGGVDDGTGVDNEIRDCLAAGVVP